MYSYTLPLSKKEIAWHPLTVNDTINVETAHRADNMKPLLFYSLVGARIDSVGGEKPKNMMVELRSWDSVDFEMFAEEISRVENDRLIALRKDTASKLPPTAVADALERVKLARAEYNAAFDAFAEVAQALEASGGPLGQART